MSNLQRNGLWRRSLKRHSITSPTITASQLRRSASFNSSGRSSGSNYGDDMFSDDISVGEEEEDVSCLSDKVRSLQEQLSALSETGTMMSQQQLMDSYSRSRHENGQLQTRLAQLEEQLVTAEQLAADKMADERQKHREHLARLQREHQLQIDNVQLRLQCVETECSYRAQEVERVREQLTASQKTSESLSQQLAESQHKLDAITDHNNLLERKLSSVTEFVEAGPSSPTSRGDVPQHQELQERYEHLQQQLQRLKTENSQLKDCCDELHVQVLASRVAEGRQLLQESGDDVEDAGPSLAEELQQHQQSSIVSCPEIGQLDEIDAGRDKIHAEEKWRRSYLEQQEVNRQLRMYIDNILLNIVEHHPELLEVKQPPLSLPPHHHTNTSGSG